MNHDDNKFFNTSFTILFLTILIGFGIVMVMIAWTCH